MRERERVRKKNELNQEIPARNEKVQQFYLQFRCDIKWFVAVGAFVFVLPMILSHVSEQCRFVWEFHLAKFASLYARRVNLSMVEKATLWHQPLTTMLALFLLRKTFRFVNVRLHMLVQMEFDIKWFPTYFACDIFLFLSMHRVNVVL